MAAAAVVPATPIIPEAVIPPVAIAEVPAVMLGTEAPVLTADQTAAAEALAARAAADAAAATDATKAAADKVTADAKIAADALAAAGAPDKYEFKAPAGTEYDSGIVAAFEASAREANLPQLAAQKLLDGMSPKIAEMQVERATAIRKEWFEASRSDKDFGGAALEANLGIAKKALDTFGTPELNQLLVSTGLGNHPEIIRLMFKAGKALSEDTFVAGTGPSKAGVSAASVLYDNTPTSK
jgi:hypothetical protein